MDKASDTAKLVVRLAKKITTMEEKVDNFCASDNSNHGKKGSEVIALNNGVKIEGLQKEIEKLKLEIVQLKDESASGSKLDLNSNNTNKWYKTKFTSNLEAPEARRYIKDLIDTKLASFQVIFSRKSETKKQVY